MPRIVTLEEDDSFHKASACAKYSEGTETYFIIYAVESFLLEKQSKITLLTLDWDSSPNLNNILGSFKVEI